jgi:putative ABC transport system permease protein
MDTVLQDLRHSLRGLVKDRGFTFVAVVTLALGIGANATIFSIINAVLLRPLSYPEAERLAIVWETNDNNPESRNIVAAANYLDWTAQQDVFESMALFDSAGRGYNLSTVGKENEQVSGVRVTASFFSVLGVRPMLGRTFVQDEETVGRHRVVVLSHALWQKRYGADPMIVGNPIRIDGEEYTVVGVMPPEFEFQLFSNRRQLWVPVAFDEGDLERGSHSFVSIARLRPGVSMEQSRAQMEVIGHNLAEQYPRENANEGATVTPLENFGRENYEAPLLAMFGVVGFVLLIACANVANLMLARSTARQTEFAIRRALGASRWRLARQLMTESLLLALIGGAGGLFVSTWTTELLVGILPGNLRYVPLRPLETIPVDWRVIGFTWAASCVTGVLFGLLPVFSVFSRDVNTTLKEGARGSTSSLGSKLRYSLVAGEMGLALIVLAGAGLMIQSVGRLLNVDPGLDVRNVLAMEMSLPQEVLYTSPPTNKRFCDDLEARVGSLPGVVSVGAISHLPLTGAGAGRAFTIEGRPPAEPGQQPGAAYSVCSPNYFRTLGIKILEGREFTFADTVDAPGVAIINEAMAQRFFPDENPVGKRMKLGGSTSTAPWMTVVGVARDVKRWGLDRKMTPEFFRPYNQAGWPFMTILVKTESAPAQLGPRVKKALQEIEPSRAATEPETMEQVMRDSVSERRFPMLLLAAFALLALSLAAVGISGVVSNSVAQRTHEIGIRLALGAQKRDVLALILNRSLICAAAGVAIGLAGAFGLTRLLEGLLYEVRPMDPLVLGSVALVLVIVAMLASYIPARRATKVDPMVALRYE